MTIIVGNDDTPVSSGVSLASISATFILPFIFFLASSHAGWLR
jgi:hypothetical protein